MILRNFNTVTATYLCSGGVVNCSGSYLALIQLSLAANILVGPNFSNEVTRRLTSTGSVSAGRGHPSPLQHQSERSEEPEGNPDDNEGKKSEKKEDKKREEDP